MQAFDLAEHPHRRYNPLSGEWVLVSPHRAKRPWQGQQETAAKDLRPAYDPTCYLCPGNLRANGARNPDYPATYVFDNDFGALQEATPAGSYRQGRLLRAESEQGICKVICFSPRHDLTLANMDLPAIRQVVDLWQQEYLALGSLPHINYVQIFENKGAVMGCSNPHPHGQVWAQGAVPAGPARETTQQQDYYRQHGQSLLADYAALEQEQQTRLLYQNAHFVIVVPFWAVWPFETMIIPKRHLRHLGEMEATEKDAYADAIKKLTVAYDRLFDVSFPYSAGIHQRPTDGEEHSGWHLHMHFYPPLLRSASVKKFMVGYELLGEPQRDISPEHSALKLQPLF